MLKLNEALKKIEQAKQIAMNVTKETALRDYERSMKAKKHGNVYYFGKPPNRKKHTASTVHETPAFFSGNTIYKMRNASVSNSQQIRITDNSDYAVSLHSIRVNHVIGYFNRYRKKYSNIIENNIKEYLK